MRGWRVRYIFSTWNLWRPWIWRVSLWDWKAFLNVLPSFLKRKLYLFIAEPLDVHVRIYGVLFLRRQLAWKNQVAIGQRAASCIAAPRHRCHVRLLPLSWLLTQCERCLRLHLPFPRLMIRKTKNPCGSKWILRVSKCLIIQQRRGSRQTVLTRSSCQAVAATDATWRMGNVRKSPASGKTHTQLLKLDV